jgi:hypothetical protein
VKALVPELLTVAFDGVPIEREGAVLSIVIAALGPWLPALTALASVAEPAKMEIVTLPSPLQPERVTLGVDVVPFDTTADEQLAVPVGFIVMWALVKLTEAALVYVTG